MVHGQNIDSMFCQTQKNLDVFKNNVDINKKNLDGFKNLDSFKNPDGFKNLDNLKMQML